MFFIFLDVVDNCSSDLYLGEQIKVSQNEKHLAILFKAPSHNILIYKQILLILIWVLVLIILSAKLPLDSVVRSIVSVSVGEDVIFNLQNHHWEIDLSKFVIKLS